MTPVNTLLGHPVLMTGLVAVLTWDLTSRGLRPPPRRPDDDRSMPSRRARSMSTTVTLTPLTAVGGGVAVALLTVVTVMAPVVGIAGGLIVAGVLERNRRLQSRRLSADRTAALPELIDTLVALVRSGLTPALAWRELAHCAPRQLAPVIDDVIRALDHGVPFADALADAIDHLGATARGLFDALVTAERYGLPLVPVLDRLAHDAAAQRRQTLETRSRQLPVRMALPLVSCTLPAVVVLGIVPVLVATLSSFTRP